MTRIWSIQYLRAVAAMGVVVFHAAESSESKFAIGAAGVDIFFVISGFIMATLVLAEDAQPSEFLARRLIRIAPLYWLATLAVLAVAWVKPGFFYNLDTSIGNLLLSLAFVPHSATGQLSAPTLWQGWTLEYEMFFYLLCAIALVLPLRRRLFWLCATLTLLVGVGFATSPEHPVAKVFTGQLLLEFSGGVVLGAAWRAGAMPRAWVGGAMLCLGVALFGLQQASIISGFGLRVIDWGVPALLIVAGALSLEAGGRVPQFAAGRIAGDASYALYLTHGFVVSPFIWFFPTAPIELRILACTAGAMALSLAVHLWLERPLNRMLGGAIRKRTEGAARN